MADQASQRRTISKVNTPGTSRTAALTVRPPLPQRVPSANLAAPRSATATATTLPAAPSRTTSQPATASATAEGTATPLPALTASTSPFLKSTLAQISPQLKTAQASLQKLQSEKLVAVPQYNAGNVAIVAAATDPEEAALIFANANATRPRNVCIVRDLHVPVRAGLGGAAQQLYDGAGVLGAHKRVLSAVQALFARGQFSVELMHYRAGTVVVGAVERFVVRPTPGRGGAPVEYGMVVLCRVPLTGVEGTEDEHSMLSVDPAEWTWHRAVTRGVPLPVKVLEEAEKGGFSDQPKTGGRPVLGKVAIGAQIQRQTGIDKSEWQRVVAGVSRSELLKEAIETAGIPWPQTP